MSWCLKPALVAEVTIAVVIAQVAVVAVVIRPGQAILTSLVAIVAVEVVADPATVRVISIILIPAIMKDAHPAMVPADASTAEVQVSRPHTK